MCIGQCCNGDRPECAEHLDQQQQLQARLPARISREHLATLQAQLADARGKLKAVREYTVKLDGFHSRVARAAAKEIRALVEGEE